MRKQSIPDLRFINQIPSFTFCCFLICLYWSRLYFLLQYFVVRAVLTLTLIPGHPTRPGYEAIHEYILAVSSEYIVLEVQMKSRIRFEIQKSALKCRNPL